MDDANGEVFLFHPLADLDDLLLCVGVYDGLLDVDVVVEIG